METLLLCDKITSKELLSLLQPYIKDSNNIQLKLKAESKNTRLIDTAIIAAIITGGVSIISLLVNALNEIQKSTTSLKNANITITSSSGASISFPAGTSKEKIEEYISKVKDLDSISTIAID